jgi:hypothetical protein
LRSAAEPQPSSGWPLLGRLFTGPLKAEEARMKQEIRERLAQ